jgi:hypothetical protein
MSKRYFKFTDGTFTVFRGTGMVQGFRYGWTQRRNRGSFPTNPGWVGFSNSPVNSKAVTFPATEITKAEFDQLVAIKRTRVIAAGHDNAQYSSPQDAWVFNEALAEVLA